MNEVKKILIADDEAPMARALSVKLTHEGYAVTTVANGEEALAALAREHYDLLLLDLVMPKKDGFAVLEELQKTNNPIHVIVASNLGQEEDTQRVQQFGVKDYIIKSNTPIAEVAAYVKKALQQ